RAVAGGAAGGAIFAIFENSLTTVSGSTILFNHAVGGEGASGGPNSILGIGAGGGVGAWLGASLTLSASTLDHNLARGGTLADGNGAAGRGGGLDSLLALTTVVGSTVAHNQAIGGPGGPSGIRGGRPARGP